MNISTDKQATSFLFRLRSQDTPTGVSADTIDKLIKETGLSKTELTHLALRRMADDYLAYYEADDGPLTDAQLQRIDEVNTCNDIAEEEVVNRIF